MADSHLLALWLGPDGWSKFRSIERYGQDAVAGVESVDATAPKIG